MESGNRVVVTGMGVVAPNGIGLDAFWDSLINCKSGIGPITLFDVSDYPLKVAGQVKGFDLKRYMPDCKTNRLGRQTQLGLLACKMAIEHAGLTPEMLKREAPLQFVMGICSAAADIIEQAKELIMTKGADRVRPYMVGASQPHAVSAVIAQMLGGEVSVTTLSSACPSGLDAVALGAKIIKEGRADLVIVGAADSPINNTGVAGFAAARIPSLSNEFPAEETSRPFDAKSDGGPMSEGSGFLVLERLDSALARGASVYIEILAGATATDAPGSGPLDGLRRTMDMALKNAGISATMIDYICANAISSIVSDRAETEAIKHVFGQHAYEIPISSIKSTVGNPLAAAGIFQVIACALAVTHKTIPPTANLKNSAPGCDLDYVPLFPRSATVNYALANMHGMGAENSTLIMKKV
ncbi:MAG: beta-ketoacyl-[acyl-carrier-protein] synthase family protein [Verrucomicrobia bacterium]|nr:beta-ketoacyl-[acyl-carrier-protein] synthase family protein [Verrucomicrobiota bacterium]